MMKLASRARRSFAESPPTQQTFASESPSPKSEPTTSPAAQAVTKSAIKGSDFEVVDTGPILP